MKDNHCTVCPKKCHYSKHVKAPKIYVTKTKKEMRTLEDLKKRHVKKFAENISLMEKQKEELQELEKVKHSTMIQLLYFNM